jgi:hypothetical protein
MMKTEVPETHSSDGRDHPGGAWPRPSAATRRDFLYQRRLVSFRPFVADDGVPGLSLRFDGDEMMAMRIEPPLLDLFHQVIGRLKESPRIKR